MLPRQFERAPQRRTSVGRLAFPQPQHAVHHQRPRLGEGVAHTAGFGGGAIDRVESHRELAGHTRRERPRHGHGGAQPGGDRLRDRAAIGQFLGANEVMARARRITGDRDVPTDAFLEAGLLGDVAVSASKIDRRTQIFEPLAVTQHEPRHPEMFEKPGGIGVGHGLGLARPNAERTGGRDRQCPRRCATPPRTPMAILRYGIASAGSSESS